MTVENDNYNSNKSKGRSLGKINIILAFIVVILLIVVIYRFNLIEFDFDGDEKNGNGSTDGKIIIPLPTEPIINTHEHIDNPNLLNRWLESQRLCNVSSTIMVGSPNSTFWSIPNGPFIKYLENNEIIIKMAQDTNGEIIAFPTLNPNDENNLELLKSYLDQGARGLNLWTGHHGTLTGWWGNTTLYDWLGPLNRTDMDPIYEYCQKNNIPIIWSNNLGIKEIRENLWPILERFPDMIVKIPHFGICFREYNLPFIESYLDNYTGLYTCFSWGHPDFVIEKFENISNGNRTKDIKDFFFKYQDRILFGTDIVPTDNKRKTVEWMRRHTQVYIDMLEKQRFYVEIYNFTPTGIDFVRELNGLNLPESILEKIYYKNTIKFLNGKAWNEELTEEDYTRCGFSNHIDKKINESNKDGENYSEKSSKIVFPGMLSTTFIAITITHPSRAWINKKIASQKKL